MRTSLRELVPPDSPSKRRNFAALQCLIFSVSLSLTYQSPCLSERMLSYCRYFLFDSGQDKFQPPSPSDARSLSCFTCLICKKWPDSPQTVTRLFSQEVWLITVSVPHYSSFAAFQWQARCPCSKGAAAITVTRSEPGCSSIITNQSDINHVKPKSASGSLQQNVATIFILCTVCRAER